MRHEGYGFALHLACYGLPGTTYDVVPRTPCLHLQALAKLKGSVHERVVSKTRRGLKIDLPWKHWGYHLSRALEAYP